MKGKLYETLIGTDDRLAVTISGEELKEFIEDVMADAKLRADVHIRIRRGSEGESSRNPRRHGHGNEDLRQIRPSDILFRCPDVRANGSKHGQIVPDDIHLETIDEQVNTSINRDSWQTR